jgi:Immunity protein 32
VLFTVELAEERVAEGHLDEEGLDLLVDGLTKPREHQEPEHDHLMTPSWAGTELTEDRQGAANDLIHMLTVYYHPHQGPYSTSG